MARPRSKQLPKEIKAAGLLLKGRNTDVHDEEDMQMLDSKARAVIELFSMIGAA